MGDLLLMQAAKLKVFDGFNRADSAVTLGNTNTGQAWVVSFGVFGIESNRTYAILAPSLVFVECNLSDGIIYVDMPIIVANFVNLVARYTDGNNYLRLCPVSGSWALQRRQSSGTTTIATYGVAANNGDNVGLKMAGGSIVAIINGVEMPAVTETFNQASTKHGLLVLDASALTARFDNFKVVTL